jgi:hypothetical protein
MFKKSLKQKLLEKLYREHGIMLDPMDMVSFRRNGFGSRIVSWGTIHNEPEYQSFETMADCLKYPTKLVRHNFGRDREITIEIDFEKIVASNKACSGLAAGSAKLSDLELGAIPVKADGSPANR